MPKISNVFRIFEDGKVHEVGEIAEKVSLSKFKVRKVLDFLAEFDFVEFDRRRSRAKASPAGMGILSRDKKSSKFPVFF